MIRCIDLAEAEADAYLSDNKGAVAAAELAIRRAELTPGAAEQFH